MPSRTANGARSIDVERQEFRARLANAIKEEDDPLAVYDQFVQWTIKNYGQNDPASGLVELLQQATREFKDDPIYRTDLRYLKLWTLYAARVERPEAIAIYANLLAKEIGTSFAILYEGYAAVLEADGRRKDADVIYRHGIKRMARPLERLKTRHREFQSRTQHPQTSLALLNPASGSNSTGGPRRNCLEGRANQNEAQPSASSSSGHGHFQNLASFNSTPAARYASMLAPPDPNKRPEKLRFELSLLYTRESGEFSIQEARARSMGLLGKRWGPPPPPSSISMPVNFNDDGTRSGMRGRRRSTLGGGEPTVTINTREALEDVFGMYNSPDKTVTPWKENPSMRRVEPMTPSVTPRPPVAQGNENAIPSSSSFRSFVDENSRPDRTPSTKFTPFIDQIIDQKKVSLTTPRPALSVKESTTSTEEEEETTPRPKPSTLKPLAEASNAENVFSRVFTPAQVMAPSLAPLRDVFTDDHGKPQPKTRPVHERAKSHHDVLSPGANEPVRTFTPFVDENAKTPFKVFSRPPEQPENAFTPKTPSAAFTPFTDPKPAFTPFRDAPSTSTATSLMDKEPGPAPQSLPKPSVLQAKAVVRIDDSIDDSRDLNQYQDEDESFGDEAGYEHYEAPLTTNQEYEEGESYQEIPLGGRFGKFNVMTPITERTFEYTTSTRGEGTPSERFRHASGDSATPVFIPQQRDEQGAAVAAERLAAELREGEGEVYDEDEPLEPLRLAAHLPPKDSPPVAIIEEKTGSLSLGDTLTLGAKFRPPNPCNPFDPPIMGTLLSRIPSDPHFYDLRDRDSGKLDGLQKFAKKVRKTSGGSSMCTADVAACFSLELEGHRFIVSDKLGEGGFGAVFKARDMGSQPADEDSDDDPYEDEVDEESSSMVALKVVKPRNLWEYHVLRRLHSALPAPLQRSVVLPHALYAFRDESFLVLDLCPQGTLLSIVNNAVAAGVSQQGACLDELLVVFFTVELLRLLEAAHKAGFIHGDLKIDNCLLRLEDVPGGGSAWSSVYQPSGAGGWSHKGLKVIDFGRTIDTRLFPPGQRFIAEWPTDDRDCFEAREDRPWTFQTDYFGLVGIIYCMLFGKYIQGSSVVLLGDRYRISTPLKRYWQTELWNRLFDVLLNPCLVRPDGQLPVSEELGALRGEMEAWLQANCNRTSNTLKGLLKKVEVSCYVH